MDHKYPIESSDYELSGLCAQIPIGWKLLLDQHWLTNDDQSNPIQISRTREYPGNDIIDRVQHELSLDSTKNVSYEIMTNIL